jgi:hypothetical protein
MRIKGGSGQWVRQPGLSDLGIMEVIGVRIREFSRKDKKGENDKSLKNYKKMT